MSGDTVTPTTRRVAWVVVVLLVVAGVGWALWSQGTAIPERIASEAAGGAHWELVAEPDPGGLARVPVLGRLVDPGRGEWTWRVTGPPQEVAAAVTSWVLQRPVSEPTAPSGWTAEVAADRGLEGRTWDGQLIEGGTTTLRGEAATALRSVTVTVEVQPVPITDDLTQVTVRVD